jgi:hypothetical protein
MYVMQYYCSDGTVVAQGYRCADGSIPGYRSVLVNP